MILTKNGEPEGVSKMDQDQLSRLKGKTFQSGSDKLGVIDTNVVSEESMHQLDYTSLAKQLGKGVASALREHGDEIAFLSAKAISEAGCTIHVQYKADEQGETWEDDFNFQFSENGVTMEGQEICQLSQQSGEVKVQQDLVKDAVLAYIDSKSNPEKVDQESELTEEWPSDHLTQSSSGQVDMLAEKDLILGFKKAVMEYREDPKDPEKIKELFRQSRGFEGDDISHKFKNAVKAFKSLPEEPSTVAVVSDEAPVESPSDPRTTPEPQEPNNNCEGSITLNVALLLRLLEYANEEVKDDVELHYIVQNLQNLAGTGKCLSMEDYETVIQSNASEDEVPEDEQSQEIECQSL